MKRWVGTDDPDDPCAYCVQWFFVDANGERVDENADDFDYWEYECAPFMPKGPVERLYLGIHAECAQAVADYEASHDQWGN